MFNSLTSFCCDNCSWNPHTTGCSSHTRSSTSWRWLECRLLVSSSSFCGPAPCSALSSQTLSSYSESSWGMLFENDGGNTPCELVRRQWKACRPAGHHCGACAHVLRRQSRHSAWWRARKGRAARCAKLRSRGKSGACCQRCQRWWHALSPKEARFVPTGSPQAVWCRLHREWRWLGLDPRLRRTWWLRIQSSAEDGDRVGRSGWAREGEAQKLKQEKPELSTFTKEITCNFNQIVGSQIICFSLLMWSDDV